MIRSCFVPAWTVCSMASVAPWLRSDPTDGRPGSGEFWGRRRREGSARGAVATTSPVSRSVTRGVDPKHDPKARLPLRVSCHLRGRRPYDAGGALDTQHRNSSGTDSQGTIRHPRGDACPCFSRDTPRESLRCAGGGSPSGDRETLRDHGAGHHRCQRPAGSTSGHRAGTDAHDSFSLTGH